MGHKDRQTKRKKRASKRIKIDKQRHNNRKRQTNTNKLNLIHRQRETNEIE